MQCMVEAVWGGWAWAGTSRSSSGAPLLPGAGSFMIHSAVTSSAISGVSKIFEGGSLAWHRLQVFTWWLNGAVCQQLAQLLLRRKGEAKSTKPRLCFGQEGGISLSTSGSMDEGLETKSPGWDVGKLVYSRSAEEYPHILGQIT